MNTVRGQRCQTLRALAAAWCFLLVGGGAFAEAEPPPVRPAWQEEIDAARLLEGSLALAPARDSADQASRHQRLQEMYRQLAQKYPDETAAQKAAGDFFARDNQPAAAVPFLGKASRLDPHDGDTLHRLGEAYLELGDTRAAYAQFQKAVDARPEVVSYQSDLANVLYLFRRDLMSPPIPGLPDEQAALTQALAHFRRASDLAPGDEGLAQAYAETFYICAKPDWTQALAAWERVLALSGDKRDFPNSHLARISLRLGRPEDAAGYLARMHDPMFDPVKAKLLQQAERQRAAAKDR